MSNERTEEIQALAKEVVTLARDHILMNLRFLDVALWRLTPMSRPGLFGVAADDSHFYYDPVFLLRRYRVEKAYPTRALLHSLLHCVFFHSFGYTRLDMRSWDLACDMAVESVVLSLNVPDMACKDDPKRREKLSFYEKEAYGLTAEKLYKYLKHFPLLEEEYEQLQQLFAMDLHEAWEIRTEQETIPDIWKKISERVKADLKSFSGQQTKTQSMEANLEEATRERYDYATFLRKFAVRGEDIKVNEDEFDYIYYTYGLDHYGNMPLVEPLEYSEVHKVREFVIAIDTSASCRGRIVRAFLRQTYALLTAQDTFFHKSNIHIIQCDSQVQSDTRITCDSEFEDYMRNGKLTGFGSTDFRPVFQYVNQLVESREFENLKGVLYFTDGYGIYPEHKQDYDVAFVFLDEDERRAPVPPWAIKVVLDSEALEEAQENEY